MSDTLDRLAYTASKAAIDAFTGVAAAECADHGVQFTTMNMPLVSTAMSAPTKLYDRFPAPMPEQAAQLICDAICTRADHVGPHGGAFTELPGTPSRRPWRRRSSARIECFPIPRQRVGRSTRASPPPPSSVPSLSC